jgi:hypothetical protein
MQISKFAGDPRCAIARAAATIEVNSICILPFGSAGSWVIRPGFASSNGAVIRTVHCRTRLWAAERKSPESRYDDWKSV